VYCRLAVIIALDFLQSITTDLNVIKSEIHITFV